jgi:beta-lactam-binding protein with PASTA domain
MALMRSGFGAPADPVVTRNSPWRKLLPTTVQGRDRLRIGIILGLAVSLGYFLTCVAYPAPLITRDHSVPRVLGLPLAAAEQELVSGGFKPRREEPAPDPVVPAGHILWQDPAPETGLVEGAVVTLTPSSGPGAVLVPDVGGFELAQARQVLEAAGLRIGEIDTVANAAQAGVVVATRPSGGVSRVPATPIDLVVSRGPAEIRVPDLVGLEQEEARDRLESVGLRLGSISRRTVRRGPSGVVVEQRPAGGSLAPQEGRVSLVISN